MAHDNTDPVTFSDKPLSADNIVEVVEVVIRCLVTVQGSLQNHKEAIDDINRVLANHKRGGEQLHERVKA
jgi:hypothetical protein